MNYSAQQYFNIAIRAEEVATKIWLGDSEGSLVKMAVGTLSVDLMPGHYNIEFGLGTANYPIHIDRDMEITQKILKNRPTRPRPVFNIHAEDENLP